MSSDISILLILEKCLEIKKEYFKIGFPPEIYEILMCIQASFFLSHKIRINMQLFLVFLKEDLIIHYRGDKLRYLGPDERSIGMLLMKALDKKENLKSNQKMQTTPGIWIKKQKFNDFILDLVDANHFIYLADNYSAFEPEINTETGLIFVIPNSADMNLITNLLPTTQNLIKFGVNDLPLQMKNYLTILKFHQIVDKISKVEKN